MRSKIFIFSFIIILWSCKKEDSNTTKSLQTFRGTVRDYVSRSGVNPVPVANAQIQLIKAEEASGFGSSLTFVNPEAFYTTSDSIGNFEFTLPMDLKKVFVVEASKPGYVFIEPLSAQTISGDEIIQSNYVYLDIASVVNISFHDTLSTSLNDSLFLRVIYSSNPVVFGASINKVFNYTGIISNSQSLSFTDSISGTTFSYAELQWSVADSIYDIAFGNPYYTLDQFHVNNLEINF
jgi:hypothetical protein